MSVDVVSTTNCSLGEGPLWHPERQGLFWFDINAKTLFCRENDAEKSWSFADHVSAAGWIDRETLLIASETGLFRFDMNTASREAICQIESDNPVTRSNDGRADPWGGFWIGTMGKQAERSAGAIYRYYRGELRLLFEGLTIPNAISFPPGGDFACFADTRRQQVMRQPLDPADGWPKGEAEVYLDLTRERLNPDGAVWDADGYFWNAQWGAARLARYDANGQLDRALGLPVSQVSCPAFGGADLDLLFATTASEGLSEAERRAQPHAGQTFVSHQQITGQMEHRVVL